MIHRNNNENVNENENSLNTLDTVIEKLPDITYPDMMEECGNK